MADTVIVDFNTLLMHPKKVKGLVIDVLVNRIEPTMITVLNANEHATIEDTQTVLTMLKFPFDAVLCNPLEVNSDPIVFKTMFANRLLDTPDHRVVNVIDDDIAALEMWRDSRAL